MNFTPLNVPFDLSAIDLSGDNGLAGIAYDSAAQRYIITTGFDPTKTNVSVFGSPYSVGIYIFDKNGKMIDGKVLPVEYQALKNPVTGLTANNPILLDDSWILVHARTVSTRSNALLINTSTWEIRDSGYSEINIPDAAGTAFATIFNTKNGLQNYFYTTISKGVLGQVSDILNPPVTPDYKDQFSFGIFNVVGKGNTIYIQANGTFDTVNGAHLAFTGLFSGGGDGMKLIQLLPSFDYCNLAGVDAEGNCKFFVSGANDRNRAQIEKALSDFALATGK
jgi:hypothetical protein